MSIDDLISLISTRFQYKSLYHFSDRSNWDSISKYGLLSKEQLESCGITPPCPGGDSNSRQSDRDQGLYDYVSLSFTPQNPMAYACRQDGRHPDQIMISVSTEVLKTSGALVSFGFSNSPSSVKMPVPDAINQLDLEVWLSDHGLPWASIKDRVDTNKKIEVLIPKLVAPKNLLDHWKPT